MSNISKVFENGKAFIAFVTSGDPSLEITEQLVYAMDEAGADLVELGIPFSDPTAEGPVIQEANIRALSGGVTKEENTDSHGIYDLCQRGFFLWDGTVYKNGGPDRHGRPDPAGYSLRRKG